MPELAVRPSTIPGLLVVNLAVHHDRRGWFKEAWQRAKMVELGLPDFGPVQWNISFNREAGVTRGLHAEPWDKLVTLATGRAFGAWVDLRRGPTFGMAFTIELTPDVAVFVPRGVANGYQTLEGDTAYAYLVNDHWSRQAVASYTFVNLADETAAIEWPLPLDPAGLSDADRNHPRLADVVPMAPRRTVIVGANGQLGRALQAVFPDAVALGSGELDIADPAAVAAWDWQDVGLILNAAAYTAVDAAETEEGRRAAWRVNVDGVRHLVDAARRQGATLVHVSSDYVFDGVAELHGEDEPVSPLSVYGASKAAGDAVVATYDRHYLIRTSWVIGDGKNFVRTMADLAARGVSPKVVDDQVGRLTFTSDLADAVAHLLRIGAPFGTYNVSSAGPPMSWCDVAKRVFELSGRDPDDVGAVSTAEYFGDTPHAPRPASSLLALDKIVATGFRPGSAADQLRSYLDD